MFQLEAPAYLLPDEMDGEDPVGYMRHLFCTRCTEEKGFLVVTNAYLHPRDIPLAKAHRLLIPCPDCGKLSPVRVVKIDP